MLGSRFHSLPSIPYHQLNYALPPLASDHARDPALDGVHHWGVPRHGHLWGSLGGGLHRRRADRTLPRVSVKLVCVHGNNCVLITQVLG